METGYVKFFDTREGKLFGFLVDELGNELFFHYSNGCEVGLDGNDDITFKQHAPRFPKKGDRLMFRRGKNAKGPKATAWCLESEYRNMDERRKRDLTFEEAKRYLADKPCDILEHTYSTTMYGGVTTIVSTTVAWMSSDGKRVIANGEFMLKTVRYSGGHEKTQTENRVIVHAPDPKFSWQTMFLGDFIIDFMTIGKPREVVKGRKLGILWNGGWEDYVIDANFVRDMTRDELDEIGDSVFPTTKDGAWLRCRFTGGLGHEGQVVKVLRHLGGGE